MSVLFLTYIFCLVLGGTFVGLSVFGGALGGDVDADLDAEIDVDMDLDVDADADFDLDADAQAGLGEGIAIDAGGLEEYDREIEVSVGRCFNPLVSFKFYTFLLTFFGLTGVIFTGLKLWSSELGVFALSLTMGLLAGLGIAYTMFRVNDSSGSEGITAQDYVGISAQVMLPLSHEQVGKVRLHIKGRFIEMPARAADDEVVFDFNQDCFVLGIEDGVVQVVEQPALLEASGRGQLDG